MLSDNSYDVVVIGGGFFGCCLALYLRSTTDKICLIEKGDTLLGRASRNNQARVHTGFHYPRSFVTALRSRALQAKFAKDFEEAVLDDFTMLYAIARRRTKVSGQRFYRMFNGMGAPIQQASAADIGLFNDDLIESVFACKEYAFDWKALQNHMQRRLDTAGIEVIKNAEAASINFSEDRAHVEVSGERTIGASVAFNATYSGINDFLIQSGIETVPMKHELAEIALVNPPAELNGRAVTVMDGPFFSIMPYPSEDAYSLTHVRYTPHLSWRGSGHRVTPSDRNLDIPLESRWRHMVLDAARYMPCITDAEYLHSIYETKSVLEKNEVDDGRPILFRQHRQQPGFYSVMGGKIDNIYDLFDTLPIIDQRFKNANDGYLI